MKNKFLWLLLLSFFSVPVFAQTDSIYSAILKEKRLLQVILPEHYKPGGTEKYDVLYVLDGEGNTRVAADVVHFLQEEEAAMPPTIIVGIFNTDRDRDLLPTHNESNKSSGGADRFLEFIKKDLIPYVNKTYPSNGDATLSGHSFGGLFVTYALLTEPELFRSYIAEDPSFWWDNDVMIGRTADKLSKLAGLNKTLLITGRQGKGLLEMRLPKFDSVLKKYAPSGLKWKLVIYADETHGTVKLKSIYDGLKFTYYGYNPSPVVFHPMNGIMLPGQPIHFWYFNDTTHIHYTIDGSKPMVTAANLQEDNILTTPGKVTIRRLTNRDRYDQTFSGEFVAGTYLAAGRLPARMKPGGFNYAYYEGTWSKIPDFKTLQPVKTGKIDSTFSINKLPHQNSFALVITGELKVNEDGYHLFALETDDGSRLYVGGRLLMDIDGVHTGNGTGKTYIIPLKKGFYPVRLEYFQKDGDKELDLEYMTPGNLSHKTSVPIPWQLQYGRE